MIKADKGWYAVLQHYKSTKNHEGYHIYEVTPVIAFNIPEILIYSEYLENFELLKFGDQHGDIIAKIFNVDTHSITEDKIINSHKAAFAEFLVLKEGN